MSGQITIFLSIAAIVVSFGAVLIAVKTVTGLIAKYTEFVESQITTLRAETKKQNSDTFKKMKEVLGAMDKGGDTTRDARDEVTAMEARITQLTAAVARLEKAGARSLTN